MDNNQPSPLETLRQLKEMLDAGAITQPEFNKLKQQLLFPEAAPVPAPPVPPVQPPLVAPTETHVVPPPVDDPLLPPLVETEPAYAAVPPAPAAYSRPAPVEEFDGPEEEPAPKSPLATILIIGGIVLLLAVVGYLVLGNRSSERLTSNSITAADTTSVAIEEGPQAEQLTLPPVAAPETVRMQPNLPATAQTLDTTTAAASAADAAAAEAATRARVQRTLTALYSDLQAAPFSASQYFAPQVERFYSLQNTTPADIDAELSRTHFPEFTESKIGLEPGTLQISAPAEDGSVTVTYQERGRSLRKSLNQYQQTLAQVRARFDRTGKLTYFRQERLLQNSFTDAKPATPATPPASDATPPADQQ